MTRGRNSIHLFPSTTVAPISLQDYAGDGGYVYFISIKFTTMISSFIHPALVPYYFPLQSSCLAQWISEGARSGGCNRGGQPRSIGRQFGSSLPLYFPSTPLLSNIYLFSLSCRLRAQQLETIAVFNNDNLYGGSRGKKGCTLWKSIRTYYKINNIDKYFTSAFPSSYEYED